MGRRSLPKLKPDVEFQHLLTDVRSLNPPFDPSSLFANPGELEVEVGSGKGLFLLNASEARPHHNFLGVEIAQKYARFAAYRLAQHGRTNAHVLAGDALRLFRELLPDACAAAVHVYFPDPWWKERHHKRRVVQPAFVRDLTRVLCPGGEFHFWTDVESYYEMACDVIRAESELQGPYPVSVSPAAHDMDYRTHFERRMRRHDHPVFRSYFVQPETAPRSLAPRSLAPRSPAELGQVDVSAAQDQPDPRSGG